MTYTDKEYWRGYWETVEPDSLVQTSFLDDIGEFWPGPGSRCIEIGGFPGGWCAHLKKTRGYNVTALDLVYVPEVVEKLEATYALEPGSIKFIEADFLTYRPSETYDLAMSFGFIEHFDDARDILQRHCDLLRQGGRLIVSLPNFRGLNGLLHRLFDREVYDRHNIQMMDVAKLDAICRSLNLKEHRVFYWGGRGPGDIYLWVDRTKVWSPFVLPIRIASRLMSILRINVRWLAPHIVILAEKT